MEQQEALLDSPVFDNNQRIVGQLTGGSGAECGGERIIMVNSQKSMV